eukprot:31500-Pelagococcus_subviridis.AAC.8
MAPATAAVEIDPRLLRQLEDEYESLKNDRTGAMPRPNARVVALRRRSNARPRCVAGRPRRDAARF